jgi:thiosulfate/3-mercaptopyruvate sulfurtransferase
MARMTLLLATLLVSAGWLAQHANDVTIVHVGTAEKYAAGHIAGARFVPMAKLVTTRGDVPNELPPVADLVATLEAAGVGDGKRIVIYGDDPLSAARLFWTLEYLGKADQVALLDGGLAQWKGAIATGAPAAAPATFTAKVDERRLVTLEELKSGKAIGTLVDARPPAHFADGRIGDATNVFWQQNLDADGLLLPVERLRALHANVKPGPAISYCRSGMQSSFEYFVLRLLGYDAAMYDGSYSEWSADAARK